MGVVSRIRNEVAEMQLKSHNGDSMVTADHIRIMELLERQATIIEILGERNPDDLKRFLIEDWKP